MRIKDVLSGEFTDYGYRLTSTYLRKKGYLNNHRKPHRIIKQAGMLKIEDRINRNGIGRKFMKFRKAITSRPVKRLAIYIKMVWLSNRGKVVHLLATIDVNALRISREYFSLSIETGQVIAILSVHVLKDQSANIVVFSNNNGRSFIANDVREYLGLVGVDQEATHLAKP